MKTRPCIFVLLTLLCLSCGSEQVRVTSSFSEAVKIDSSFDSVQDSAYICQLVPIKHLKDSIMNHVIGYAPEALTRVRPESNLINWGADALLEIARRQTKGQVDAAVVNIGGLRCDISAGDVTVGTIYSLMPFDNSLVVVTMEGRDILDLCNTFARRRGEGVSGIRMVINGDKAENVTIGGKKVVPDAVYYIATSDYLSTGTDEMVAFTRAIDKLETGQKIRDLYLDYVKEKGQMKASVDGRMSVKKYSGRAIGDGN